MTELIDRRAAVRTAAWAVPVVVVGAPARAFACSPTDQYFVRADLSLSSVKPANPGLGSFTFRVCNISSPAAAMPAGSAWSLRFSALAASGGGNKDLTITPPTGAGFTVSPTTSTTINQAGPLLTVTYTVTLSSPLPAGSCLDIPFGVQSFTGQGSVDMRLDVTHQRWDNDCGVTDPLSQQTIGTVWGTSAT